MACPDLNGITCARKFPGWITMRSPRSEWKQVAAPGQPQGAQGCRLVCVMRGCQRPALREETCLQDGRYFLQKTVAAPLLHQTSDKTSISSYQHTFLPYGVAEMGR